MQHHHFALGQVVRLRGRDGAASNRVARYKITRLLPSKGVGLRYCVEHEEFLFSRLAWETDMIGVILPRWRIERPSNNP
jgi:hypothetical protein